MVCYWKSKKYLSNDDYFGEFYDTMDSYEWWHERKGKTGGKVLTQSRAEGIHSIEIPMAEVLLPKWLRPSR